MRTLAPTLALGLLALPASAQSTPQEGAAALPEVKVKAKKAAKEYKPEGLSSPKQAEPLRDLPQTVSVVPQSVMSDQGVSSLRDALRNVAGISLAAGEGGAQGDNLTLRGFSARNDLFVDGMRDFGSYYRDAFNLESVEVIKGASSMLFGRGATGGTVNQVSKSVHLRDAASASFTAGSDDTRRALVDFDAGLDANTAFRLNAMAHDSGVAGRDLAENRRFGFAPTLAFGLRTPTVSTLSWFHQAENNVPDYGVPWFYDRPADVRRENHYGFRRADHLKTDVDIFTAKVEHSAGEAFSFRDQARYGRYVRDFQITEARMPATGITPATPLDSITVTRGQLAGDSVETFLQNQFDLTFKRGGNTLVAGAEVGRETSSPVRYAVAGVPGTSLTHPDEDQAYTATGAPASSRVKTTAKSWGVYVLDTFKVGETWEFLGGLRHDRFAVDYRQSVAPAAAFSRTDAMTSFRAGVVYKPAPQGSVYASWGTSFNPSAESLSLSASTAQVEPEKNRNLELGTKWDLLEGRLSLSGALYRLEKTHARIPDPTPGSLSNILGGNQRVQGFELGFAGRLAEHWQVFGGYALANSEVVYTTTAHTQGNPLANAPKHTATLWTSWTASESLELGAGAQAVSSRAASSTAIEYGAGSGDWRLKVAEGYVKLDAMAKYRLNRKVDFQLNVLNLADRKYWDQLHPGHVVPGAGRTFLAGMTVRF